MIHEGPLLEYAGRDLAYLQWAAAGAPLDRPRARRSDLPAPRAERVVAARLAPRRPRRSSAPVSRSWRRSSPRCGSCSSRACSGSARSWRCSGSPRTWWGRHERRRDLGPRRARPRRRHRPAPLGGGRARHRAGARPRRRRARRGDERRATLSLPSRSRRGPSALATLFFVLVSRTREPRPVRAGVAPLVRAGGAVALALVLTWLVPTIGLVTRDAERAVLALVAFGVATTATRRATLFQVIGIVLVENGLALAALEATRCLVARDRARRGARPDADRARRGGLPRADLRRVRKRRQRRAAEPP